MKTALGFAISLLGFAGLFGDVRTAHAELTRVDAWAESGTKPKAERKKIMTLLGYRSGLGELRAIGPARSAGAFAVAQSAKLIVQFPFARANMFMGPSVEGGALFVTGFKPAGYVVTTFLTSLHLGARF